MRSFGPHRGLGARCCEQRRAKKPKKECCNIPIFDTFLILFLHFLTLVPETHFQLSVETKGPGKRGRGVPTGRCSLGQRFGGDARGSWYSHGTGGGGVVVFPWPWGGGVPSMTAFSVPQHKPICTIAFGGSVRIARVSACLRKGRASLFSRES